MLVEPPAITDVLRAAVESGSGVEEGAGGATAAAADEDKATLSEVDQEVEALLGAHLATELSTSLRAEFTAAAIELRDALGLAAPDH